MPPPSSGGGIVNKRKDKETIPMLRPIRILLPWLDRHQAVQALLGFRQPRENEDIEWIHRRYDAQVAAVQARAAYDLPPFAIEPLPPSLADHEERFLSPLLEESRRRLRLGVVDLWSLLSFQKTVSTYEVEKRVEHIALDDWQALADVCLPPEGYAEGLQGTFDGNGRGLTFSSFNPNLRASTVQRLDRPLMRGGGREEFIGFSVTFGSNFLVVAEYKGRGFLQDGYHRTYALLKRGFRYVPCAFHKAESFSDVVAREGSGIAQEHLLGPRPPFVADFQSDDVSVEGLQETYRKVVRIRAEELLIHA
jgi:hypothetical protein